jgi:Protein of unknown function
LSAEAIDAAILGIAMTRWQKTAMIIVKSQENLRASKVEASHDDIAERIYALASQGRLEGQGDLTLWRHSEVRLPG